MEMLETEETPETVKRVGIGLQARPRPCARTRAQRWRRAKCEVARETLSQVDWVTSIRVMRSQKEHIE
jgi:hypothetical protein